MKLFNKLRTALKRVPRKAVIVAAGLALLVGIPTAISLAEFYPDRPTYDYNKLVQDKSCTDPANAYSRCGSMTGPVFNSFVNTPSYGDERAFLDARRTDQTAAGSFKNVLPNVTDGSEEVVLRTYIHNNANQTTNATGVGIAHGAKVRIALPTAGAKALRARSYISASNAAQVEDTVDLTSADQDFTVQYIPGSATLYDNDNFKAGVALDNSIVTTGATIGSDALDGNFKGCFDFEAVVQIRVKIVPKTTPKVSFTKEVALPGAADWSKKVTTKPGDHVKWLLSFENTGTADVTHTKISDKLPPHVQIVPGSVHYLDAAQNVVQNDTSLFTTGGIDFTTWKPHGGFYVSFETITVGDFDSCSITVRNIARNTTDQTGQIEDYSDVVITKPNCVPPTPSFRCDALDQTKINDTTYKFTGNGSVDLATITGYIFKVNGAVKQDSASNVYNFSQDKPGDYTVTVQVKTDKGTTGVVSQCTKKITIKEQTTPAYSCDLLEKKAGKDGRTYSFVTTATAAGGAKVKQYRYNFGDSTPEFMTNINPSPEHTFPQSGTFTVTVSVDFTIGDKVQEKVVGQNCKVVITTTTQPTTLPNTGPGDVAGIFAAVTVAGALVHRYILSRRFL